jgi:hypothetical protein
VKIHPPVHLELGGLFSRQQRKREEIKSNFYTFLLAIYFMELTGED